MSDLIAEQYRDSKALKCDYVQLAHHGQSGGSFDLYKLTNAKYALWCAPKWLFDNDTGTGPESGPYTSKVTVMSTLKYYPCNYFTKVGFRLSKADLFF